MQESDRLCARLVPELDVTDFRTSLRFYVDLVGFTLVFERRAECFAYLELDGVELMIQEAAGPGRRFRTAPLKRPFGRGINLQVAVRNVDVLYASILETGIEPVVPIEDRWYNVEVLAPSGRYTDRGPSQVGNRQFVVADPDGYLLRFFTGLGVGPR